MRESADNRAHLRRLVWMPAPVVGYVIWSGEREGRTERLNTVLTIILAARRILESNTFEVELCKGL